MNALPVHALRQVIMFPLITIILRASPRSAGPLVLRGKREIVLLLLLLMLLLLLLSLLLVLLLLVVALVLLLWLMMVLWVMMMIGYRGPTLPFVEAQDS